MLGWKWMHAWGDVPGGWCECAHMDRCFCVDMGLSTCLRLCVCLYQCVRCPWTQDLWRDPMFGFLHRRWGRASASTPTCGCTWAPFLCLLAHGGSSLPSLPGHMGHNHETMTGRAWNRGYGKQEQPEGQCQLLLPVGQTAAWCLSAPPLLPGGRGFLHLTETRFSPQIKSCRLCFVEKRQHQLPAKQQSR